MPRTRSVPSHSTALLARFPGLAALALLLLPAFALQAQEDGGIFVFPREYWRLENDQRVVGDGGKLVTMETEDGEQFEVVEYAPTREAQRRGDIVLFSTVPAKTKEEPQVLQRPMEVWQNGVFVGGSFKQPDVVVRTIFRRGSEAYDGYVDGLYETAQLNERLKAIGWLVGQAKKAEGFDEALQQQVNQTKSYAAARQTLQQQRSQAEFIDLLIAEFRAEPARSAAVEAQGQTIPALQEKRQALLTRIAELEKAMGDDLFDKQNPNWREKELARLDEYELRAEIHYLQTIGNDEIMRGARALDAAKTLLGLDELPVGDDGLADSQAIITLLEARLAAERQASANPDPGAFILGVAKAVDAAFAALPTDDMVRAKWAAAFPDGAVTKLTEDLEALDEATADIRVLDYGSYRVTMISQFQGIENCLGTPVIVTAGGVKRTFWPLDWPGSGRFAELSFVVDFREPDDWILMGTLPRPAGRIVGYIRSYDEYNATRLRGWEFADSSTSSHLRAAIFAGDITDKDPGVRWAELQRDRRRHNGSFEITVTLGKTQRHTRGMGGPDASLDGMTLDAFIIDPVRESPIVLRQVLAQKNWFRPGEDQRAMAWLHNRTASEQTGTLRTIWISGLADEQVMDERPVTVGAHSAARVVVDMDMPDAPPLWGQEIRMELTIGGETQTETTTFSIHPNTYAVMMHGGHQGYHPYADRRDMMNHQETFSSTFCDSAYVLPDDLVAPYVRSMSDVIGHILQSRAEAQRNDELGVASVHYIFPGCTGHKSYEMYKKHPEWFTRRLFWTEAMDANHRRVQEIGMKAFYEDKPEEAQLVMGKDNPYPLLHLEQPINMAHDSLYDALVEDLITFSYAVDWDGGRWDGGPFMVFERDFLGRVAKHPETGEPLTTLERRKDVAAMRMREMKRRVREHHPHWVWGSNGDSFGYLATFLSLENDPPPVADYPHFREFMDGGGGMMDEGWMNAYIYADNRNKAADYLKLAFKQAQGMKQAGGYLQCFSPERDGAGHWNVDHIYYTMLPHLAGATYYGKLSGSPWSQDGPIYFFVRYSEFFLNNAWRPLPDADRRVLVDLPDVWAPEASSIEYVSDDHVRVVVPIINKHPRERLYDSQNRYSVMPRRVDQPFSVTVQAPDGFGDVSPTIYELTCEPKTAATKLESTQDGDRSTVVLQDLALFNVLVLDYRRTP